MSAIKLKNLSLLLLIICLVYLFFTDTANAGQYGLRYMSIAGGSGVLSGKSSGIRARVSIQTMPSGQASSSRFAGRVGTSFGFGFAVNNAPVLLLSDGFHLDKIIEDSITNQGTSIAEIINSVNQTAISDSDYNAKPGLALIGAVNENGNWQYSLDAGVTWNNIIDISNQNALLLSADGENTRLRFLPHENYSSINNTDKLIFCAWDGTSGKSGDTGVNISKKGGNSAFSSNQGSISINIQSVNDPPFAFSSQEITDEDIAFSSILSADDIEEDSLTYSIVSQGNKGMVTITDMTAGNYIYVPYINETGSDSFTFKANDGQYDSNIATITVNINPIEDEPGTDTTRPVIELVGENPVSIVIGTIYNDTGAIAIDDVDGDITSQIRVSGEVNITLPGLYQLFYNVSDTTGNRAIQVQRTVEVVNKHGILIGSIENIPQDLIPDLTEDVMIEILDPVSKELLFSQFAAFDGSFIFENIEWQSYIIQLNVKDADIYDPQYVTYRENQRILLNQDEMTHDFILPYLTPVEESIKLTVNIEIGPDLYNYTIIDADTGETVREEAEYSSSNFMEYLESGNYRLLIIGSGYSPFEYEDEEGNKIISLDSDLELHVFLTENISFDPHKPELDVSYNLRNDGFILNIVTYDFNDTLVMKTDTPSGEEILDIYASDNAYVYTWTTDQPRTEQQFTISEGYDYTTYTVILNFYDGDELVKQDYTASYIEYAPESNIVKEPDREEFEEEYDEEMLYVSLGEREFYPLMGTVFTVNLKDSSGIDRPVTINIPPIPLDYLFIDDFNLSEDNNLNYNEAADFYDIDTSRDEYKSLTPEDILLVTVNYYTFGGEAIGNGINIGFIAASGENKGAAVRYNPVQHDPAQYNGETGRDHAAPSITLPLLLNPESSVFKELERLSDSKDSLFITVSERGDGIDGFHNEELPFMIQDDGLVLINTYHLTLMGLDAEDKKTDDAGDEDSDDTGDQNTDEADDEVPDEYEGESNQEVSKSSGSGGTCFIRAAAFNMSIFFYFFIAAWVLGILHNKFSKR
ncbi:putative Pesticidal crystal protein Cry22Aa Ig-like domain-containing protein [Candidatus Magnetomoraceae bacterium gMMP-15]